MNKYKFLFDLGNVFFDWNPINYFQNVFENTKEMEYFLNNVCNNVWNTKQDAGRSIHEAEKELIQKFPQYENLIKSYYKNHRNMIKGVFQLSIDLLYILKKKKYSCYVLSNWSAETFVGMKEEYSFLNEFDGMIISGEERLIKPDPKIFYLACDRFDLIPNKTIFIDDKIENIEAAKNLDFNVIHLIDQKKIINQVSKFINLF